MSFDQRPPSVAWEPVAVPEAPPCIVWAWFKPAASPWDVLFQVPAETRAACGTSLSMRQLLQLTGLPVERAESWVVGGTLFPVQQGHNPLLDQPLPLNRAVGGETISVRMAPLPAAPPQAHVQTPVTASPASRVGPALAGDDQAQRLISTFHSDWQTLLTIETQLASARKQLAAVQSQLQSLNRDLSPDERLVADNQDKKDWQEARRWLREAAANVSRWIRDHDLGMVSSAGNRNRIEDIYQRHIVPRKPFPGLAAAVLEFEQHRKTAQHLLVQMQSAHQNASRDGVNRARQILVRIAAKVRKSKEKRGTR